MRRTYDISDDTLKRLESSKQAAGDSSLTMTVNRLLAAALDVEDEQNKAEELKEWLDAYGFDDVRHAYGFDDVRHDLILKLR